MSIPIPLEILSIILDYFITDEDSIKRLFELKLVCKQFYKTIKLTFDIHRVKKSDFQIYNIDSFPNNDNLTPHLSTKYENIKDKHTLQILEKIMLNISFHSSDFYASRKLYRTLEATTFPLDAEFSRCFSDDLKNKSWIYSNRYFALLSLLEQFKNQNVLVISEKSSVTQRIKLFLKTQYEKEENNFLNQNKKDYDNKYNDESDDESDDELESFEQQVQRTNVFWKKFQMKKFNIICRKSEIYDVHHKEFTNELHLISTHHIKEFKNQKKFVLKYNVVIFFAPITEIPKFLDLYSKKFYKLFVITSKYEKTCLEEMFHLLE